MERVQIKCKGKSFLSDDLKVRRQIGLLLKREFKKIDWWALPLVYEVEKQSNSGNQKKWEIEIECTHNHVNDVENVLLQQKQRSRKLGCRRWKILAKPRLKMDSFGPSWRNHSNCSQFTGSRGTSLFFPFTIQVSHSRMRGIKGLDLPV